jgi:hypothetical protein
MRSLHSIVGVLNRDLDSEIRRRIDTVRFDPYATKVTYGTERVARQLPKDMTFEKGDSGLLRISSKSVYVDCALNEDRVYLSSHHVRPLYDTWATAFNMESLLTSTLRDSLVVSGNNRNPRIGALVDNNATTFSLKETDYSEAMQIIESLFPLSIDGPTPSAADLSILSEHSPHTCNLPSALAERFKDE